jgi:N-acetylmuramoyl-L-alanine amidase
MERNKRLHLTVDAATEVATNADTAKGEKAVRADAPKVASADKAPDSNDPFQDMHKVARGETLSGIARQYGVSMSALRSVNSSKIQAGGGIQVGQVLLIPSS